MALRIIDLAKAEILSENHFLAGAVGRLTADPASMVGELAAPGNFAQFTTDGESLGFDPSRVIDVFLDSDGQAPKHDLMHSVTHCLFMHPFVGDGVDENRWNLACDIAAERVVAEVLGPREGMRGKQIESALQQIELSLGSRATAEKIYRGLKMGLWANFVPLWEETFFSDEHTCWFALPHAEDGMGNEDGKESDAPEKGGLRGPEPGGDERKESDRQPDSSDDGHDVDANAPQHPCEDELGENTEWEEGDAEPELGDPADADAQQAQPGSEKSADEGKEAANEKGDSARERSSLRSEGEGEGDERDSYASQRLGWEISQRASAKAQLKEEWERIATNLSLDLQTFSSEHASALSGFVGDLELATVQRIDYTRFLRQFAAMGEVTRISDDEFDYVFYTYGMKLYGNLPLVEPLEYREEQRIREFVIVIDTSGSVQGEIVRSFIDTTFDILKSTESFHERVCLRIIQCDERVQSDNKIENINDLREWGRSMRIYGGGGTDFRPAFTYVDQLIDEGEFQNLGGLIYFTDGWGTYPEWMPGYKVAFCFYDENYRPENVPPWAVQAVLDSDAVRDAHAQTRSQ